ncbi:death-associated protein [Rattus norvegicus]|uniref:Death-associated protein n=1 Tax=Rattus norvegicus TaxID=10116 RepID=A6JMY7_RAT|nr:death-associated protein [Rattus norvegicus]
MGRKRKTRMTKNGKAPALLNQQCTSLVLLPGVTKTSPQQLHKWPTRSHMPPWTNMFLQERSISNSLASDQRPDPCHLSSSSSSSTCAPSRMLPRQNQLKHLLQSLLNLEI